MNLIAWTQNMTPEAAKAAGAILGRTGGIVGAAELKRMKPTAG